MDNSKKSPAVLSLCSGYGGLEIGLERVFGKITVLAHVEIEAFAVANLVSKMEADKLDPAPIWTDVKTFPMGLFHGCVDIITGGYPCQPFSAAGNRKGTDDPRHLWPYFRKIIRNVRPELCFFENVEGHISLGLSTVISDLEEDGYKTTWGIFSAAEVGAPHQRKRAFILAHSSNKGLQGREWPGAYGKGQTVHGSIAECRDLWPARPGEEQYEWEEPRVLAHSVGVRKAQPKGGESELRGRVKHESEE